MLTFLKWQVKSVMSTKGDEDYDENYDKNYNDFLREVPKGTKIDYRIVITVKGLIKKNVSKISEIEYCFYKDYPYVVIKNIPVVDYYVWKISKQELKKLQEMFRKIEGV